MAARVLAAAIFVGGIGCGEQPAAPAAVAPEPVAELDASPPKRMPKVPAGTRSLRLNRSISVRLAPDQDAKKIGVVARDTRVAWLGAADGPGCKGEWIEIAPRGFVCDSYLDPNPRAPRALELPKLAREELVPGLYGKVIAKPATVYRLSGEPGQRAVESSREVQGSVTVRKYKTDLIDGEEFWHIGKGEWVRVSDLRIHDPSRWRGFRLGDETGLSLPISLAVSKKNPAHRVAVFDRPGGSKIRRVAARSQIKIVESRGGYAELESGGWIAAKDVRTIEKAAPPPQTKADERWFDLDLGSQTIVAYEGSEPVYASLVSSGSGRHPTETGIYRVWIKFAETDMNGQMGEEDPYSVATVPWTQFFYKDLALHTAYWHDLFGYPKSHGCINLSPIDSRFFYFWSEPQVPAGWSMAHGIFETPGSMVRVRSKKDPTPPFRGYAKRVYESRLSATSASLGPP